MANPFSTDIYVNEGQNTADPSTQTGDISYLNKLRALRQAQSSGQATPAQVATTYQGITGKPINAPTPSALPYGQLRDARQMREAGAPESVVTNLSGGASSPIPITPIIAAKPTGSVPSASVANKANTSGGDAGAFQSYAKQMKFNAGLSVDRPDLTTNSGVINTTQGMISPSAAMNIINAPKSPFANTNAQQNTANAKAYQDFMTRSLAPTTAAEFKAKNFTGAPASGAVGISNRDRARMAQETQQQNTNIAAGQANLAAQRAFTGKESAAERASKEAIAKITGESKVGAAMAGKKELAPEHKAALLKSMGELATLAPSPEVAAYWNDQAKALVEGDKNTSPQPKTLTPDLINEYKKKAGGDTKKAAELAKADGYSVV